MRIDVNTWVGGYPWRKVPGTAPAAVIEAMDRAHISRAWVSHLPSVFWRDPMEGNSWLFDACDGETRFRAVAAIQPALPEWEGDLEAARARGAVALRVDPMFHDIEPAGTAMRELAAASAEAGLPLMLAVRLEDGRQRHPLDVAPELPAAAVRTLLRSHPSVRLVVTHADRGFIEEVHFGSTADEASRIWWDISWVWGPPEDHLEHLIGAIGAGRFLFGSGQPLRLPETPAARMELLVIEPEERTMIEHGNAEGLAG